MRVNCKYIFNYDNANNIIIIKMINFTHIYIYTNLYLIILNMYNSYRIENARNANQLALYGTCVYGSTKLRFLEKKLHVIYRGYLNFFVQKLKFKGKIYKIRKKEKLSILILVFGHSHRTVLRYTDIFLKKYKKYKIVIYGYNYGSLMDYSRLIQNTRFISKFTRRGLRLARQLILYKKNKKILTAVK